MEYPVNYWKMAHFRIFFDLFRGFLPMDGPFLILKLMDGPFFNFEANLWPHFQKFRHSRVRKSRDLWKNREIHGYQTLDTRTLEEFEKKTGDFTGFRHSRVQKSRDSWKNGVIQGNQTLETRALEEFVRKNGGFHGIQTLESPKVEGLVKKRGNSRKSNTRDSDTRGICEKKGDFTGFRHSRVRKSRDSWKNGEIHGNQTLETRALEEFVKKKRDSKEFGHSRLRKSRDLWKNGEIHGI